MIRTRNPLVMNCTAGVDPTAAGRPTRYSAPSTAPSTEPSPPTTTIASTSTDCAGEKSSGCIRCNANARHTPAHPAMNPDSANASSLVRTTGVPIAAAFASLSRTAMRRRAIPWSRQIRTITTNTSSTPSENHAKERSELRSQPKNVGRVSSVDAGSGRPVHTRVPANGSFQHGVGRTDTCMKSAKPRVVTAR